MSDLISKLSEIRSKYNCFDEDEEPYYRALSETIRILSQLADGDTISRKAAIEAILECCGSDFDDEYDCGYDDGLRKAVHKLKHLPSAQPEQEEGMWIPCKEIAREMLGDKTVEIFYDHYECSICGCTLPNLLYNQDGKPFYKFCPNCGAKMKGEQDDERESNRDSEK